MIKKDEVTVMDIARVDFSKLGAKHELFRSRWTNDGVCVQLLYFKRDNKVVFVRADHSKWQGVESKYEAITSNKMADLCIEFGVQPTLPVLSDAMFEMMAAEANAVYEKMGIPC